MLITTPGAPDANSYVTLDEANAYYASGSPLWDYNTEWSALTDEAKEQRLILAALVLNTYEYRGAKACREQALKFPRWWKTDKGYPATEDTYIGMNDIVEAGYIPPTVPQEVKYAQLETAYQVVHKMIAVAPPGGDLDRLIRKMIIGNVLMVQFEDSDIASNVAANAAKFGALSVIYLWLGRWLRRIMGGVV